MTTAMAFLHHVAAFALVAAIAVELVLLRAPIDAERVRKLAGIDGVVGLSAGVVLVVGMLRVVYFEKGTAFYFSNAAFIAKVVLFGVIALLSLHPTLKFMTWRRAAARGEAFDVRPETVRTLRTLLHFELAGVVLLILCAAMMARGVGMLR